MIEYLNRYQTSHNILLFWTLFIGIGALIGSSCMFIDSTGKILKMDAMIPYFQVLPFSKILFQNFLFPGIALLIVNGITNLIASYFLIKNKKVGLVLGTIFGFTLMLWIIIQFIIFPTNIMSILYFIFGLLQLITGIISLIFYTQVEYERNLSFDNYKINHNSKILVVYFSRMNNTKKIAYEIANESNAKILELTTIEKTKGTLGFWWCGRYGMHRWPMKINKPNVDLTKYNKVIIVSPIWVFDVCAPIREFLLESKNKIKDVEFVLVHFSNIKYKYVFKEMSHILNKGSMKNTSIVVHMGKKIKTYNMKGNK